MPMDASDPLPPRRLIVTGLAGRRGERQLFAQLDFVLAPGEALFLRGPNGSGKTTLLHCLAGLLRPHGGTVALTGGDAESDSRRDLHLLGHRSALKPALTVAENLRFWAAMLGTRRPATDRVLAAVGLAPLAGLEAGHLSAGQARRLALARLLAADRPLWLLDEPTAALDRDGEALVARLLDAHLRRGGLCVVATHHDIPLPLPDRVRTLTLGTAR